jgi:hypothetical protein
VKKIIDALKDFAFASQREKRKKNAAFFSGKIKILRKFGLKHHLDFEEYFHGVKGMGPAYLFRHPKGGYSVIRLNKTSKDLMEIESFWHLGNFEEMKAYSKYEKIGPFISKESDLIKRLEDSLRSVISWKKGDWNKVQKIQWSSKKKDKALRQSDWESKLPLPKR